MVHKTLACACVVVVVGVVLAAPGCSSDPAPSDDQDAGDLTTDSGALPKDTGTDTSVIDAGPDTGPPPLPLTCEWLKDPLKNCWRAMYERMLQCIPAAGANGTFSPDRATCTYPNAPNQVVTFAPPAASPWTNNALQKYTMTKGGALCYSFEVLPSSVPTAGLGAEYRFTTSLGSVETRFPKPRQMVLTCPDGSRYGGNVDTIFKDCGGAPGFYTISNADVGIGLFPGGDGADAGSDITIIHCGP